MYLEILKISNNGLNVNVKFHEGPLNNKIFKYVSPWLLLPFLLGQKIPFDKSRDKYCVGEIKKGTIKLVTDADKELYNELIKLI